MQKKVTYTANVLPLVAIDLGSSSFKLMAAEQVDPTSDSSPLRILEKECSSKRQCVKKGIIDNTTDAGYMIRESMLRLSNLIKRDDLPTAFTLVGGKSLRCATLSAKRSLQKSPITRNLLDNMQKECFLKVDDYHKGKDAAKPIKALDLRLEEFVVDADVYTEEPALNTIVSKEVCAKYSTFFGVPELLTKTAGAFDRAGKSIEKIIARPIAHLEALADENDELRGVAIIDMGAETTTISVFKAGRFLTCKVLPQGGRNITMDIQKQGISMENAERLKIRFGSAFESKDNVKAVKIRNVKEGEPDVIIKTDFLSQIIVARLDETMAPIFSELHLFEDQISKVYLTGGASKIRNIVQYVKLHTALPVEYGSHADWLDESTPDEYYAPEYSALVGALLLGAKHRRKKPDTKVPGPNRSWLNKIADFAGGLFDGQEDE